MNLHPETEAVLHEIKTLTGKDFEFIERESTNGAPDATIKIARKASDRPHYILYTESKYLSYLIAAECGHAKRYYEATDDKRVVPFVSKEERIVFQEMTHDDPAIKMYKKMAEHPETMIAYMHDSLISQLANMPSDLQIEQWLFDSHNALEHQQMEYHEILNKRIQEGVWFNRGLNSIIPVMVHDAMLVMNRAFFQILSDMLTYDYSRDWKKHFKQIPDGPRLENSAQGLIVLLDHLHFSPSEDKDYVDRWATHFACRDIYSWRSFDIVPDHYYDEVDDARKNLQKEM